jgi:predicted GNAT family N-acyltransferase
MAVDANFRTHGLGRMLMEFILSQPELTGVEVMLHAQLQAAGFYVKLGFSPEGEHFEEADIWHVKMKRRG